MKRTERDQSIDALLRSSFKAGPAAGGASGPCLDPETIGAWTEGRLPAREATDVEAHLASCASCQQVLAVFAQTETSTGPDAPVVSAFSRITWWAVPVAVAATAAAIWVAVPSRDRAVDEFERTVTPAIEAPRAESAAAADAVTPRAEPKPVPSRKEAAAPSLVDRADKAEQPVRQESDQDFAAAAQGAPVTPPQANAAARAPQTVAAPTQPAAGSAPPAAPEESRRRAEARVDLLRRPPSTQADGTDGLRWRIVPPGRLERSTNGGGTWAPVSLPQAVEVTGVRAAADSAIVTAADGREFRTDDRGTTWTFVQP